MSEAFLVESLVTGNIASKCTPFLVRRVACRSPRTVVLLCDRLCITAAVPAATTSSTAAISASSTATATISSNTPASPSFRSLSATRDRAHCLFFLRTPCDLRISTATLSRGALPRRTPRTSSNTTSNPFPVPHTRTSDVPGLRRPRQDYQCGSSEPTISLRRPSLHASATPLDAGRRSSSNASSSE